LAAFVDGVGTRSAAGRETGGPLPAISGGFSRWDLSPRTIQRHVDNLWALGGEIIRDLNEDPSLRRKSIEQLLHDRIDDEGGPLVYVLESEESLQRSFDSTCRKLHRFLNPSPR
jgi:hypothetical protein